MKRSTTPTHSFSIPSAFINSIAKLRIDYVQNARPIITKDEDDATIADGKISVTLTQTETNKFREGTVDVQLRILTTDGKSLASDVFTIAVEKVLNDEVMIL